MTVLRRRSQWPEADKSGSNNGSSIYEEHKTPMLFLFLYNNIFVVYKYLINVNIVTFVPHPSPSPFALYKEAWAWRAFSYTAMPGLVLCPNNPTGLLVKTTDDLTSLTGHGVCICPLIRALLQLSSH